MSLSLHFQLSREHEDLRSQARRLAWLSIGLLSLAGSLIFVTVGSSQTMKTAWISDILSALPAVALLGALRYETREPNRRFPFGYTRAISIAFLATASVLIMMGVTLFTDSALKLIRGERPPIGTMVILGRQIWSGWVMIAALGFSMICGLTLGLLKLPVAKKLHDKELQAEAETNRDEWFSEAVAIAALVLVGYGFWWADAASAALISLLMVKDGWNNLQEVVADLMDEAPTQFGGHELEDLPERVQKKAEQLEWVTAARVRLREHGRVIVGEVFVVPRDDDRLVQRIAEAVDTLRSLDWRLHTLTIMPVDGLPE
jgi:cation diffusion facilitator family transporter